MRHRPDHHENESLDRSGLDYWMRQVPDLVERCVDSLSEKNVHDLRVALRRCRTMSQSLCRIDRDSAWRKMNVEAKTVFSSLGALRDTQVLLLLLDDIAPKNDTAAVVLKELLREREANQSALAAEALQNFDAKSWNFWSVVLPPRAQRWKPDGPVFEHIALQCFLEARMLHRLAMRNRSTASYHLLRIGLKRFRYSVENFLPARHKRWGNQLRILQDALGELHDLDVLRGLLPQAGPAYDAVSKRQWGIVLRRETARRIQRYRKLTVGPKSLWNRWQSEFPAKEEYRRLGSIWLREFAKIRSADNERPLRIESFALRLFDSLYRSDNRIARHPDDARLLLSATAGLCAIDAGKPKKAASMLSRISPPLGWSKEEMEFIAAVVRHHRDRPKMFVAADRLDWPDELAVLFPLFIGIVGVAAVLAEIREVEPDQLNVAGKMVDSFEITLPPSSLNFDSAAVLAQRRAVLEKLFDRPFFFKSNG